MKNKIITAVVLVCSAIIGLTIGFSDSAYRKGNVSSSNLISSGENISGEILKDNSKDENNNEIQSGDLNITIDNNNPASIEINPNEENSDTINISDTSNQIDISVSTNDSTPKQPTYTPSTTKNLPDSVKAVYTTGWAAGTKRIRDSMIETLKENGYNAIVIDIKDEAGHLSYDSTVKVANDIGSSKKMISNVSDVIKEFKDEGFYVIGRIVTFKDPLYASKTSSIAYKKSDGSIWKDSAGNSWPNPYNTASWEYPIELAKEAATLGFDEIQFDYIRFPSSEGKTSTIAYGFDSGSKAKADVIADFLRKVMKELEPYNVVVSADVFGITTKKDGDFEKIGQDFSKIASIVDVVCPMVYPSHYYYNEYKIAKPDKEPYKVVYYSVEDAFKRYESYINLHSGDSVPPRLAKIRPYLQDFTATWLGSGNYITYGDKEVTAQIQAIYDLKVYDFCLWDPSNKYCYTAIKSVK